MTTPLERLDTAIMDAIEQSPKKTLQALTLTEALAQQGIKLRTEFEPKQRDSELAAEPSGERAESAQWLREFADMEFSYYSREATQLRKAADMLEADVSLINEGNKAQQAKRVPMDEPEDLYALALKADNWGQP